MKFQQVFQLKLSLERVGVDQIALGGGELSLQLLQLGRVELSLELGRWCSTSSHSEPSSARGGGGGGETRLELSLELEQLETWTVTSSNSESSSARGGGVGGRAMAGAFPGAWMPCLGTTALLVLYGGRGRSWRRGRSLLIARRL